MKIRSHPTGAKDFWCMVSGEWSKDVHYSPLTPASNMQLHDILIMQNMIAFHRLPVVDARTPDARGLEAVGKITVNQGGHFNQRAAGGAGEGRGQIGRFARLL